MLGACLHILRGCRCGDWNFLIVSLYHPLVSCKEDPYDFGDISGGDGDGIVVLVWW